MKTKSKISGYIIRSGVWAVFLSVAFIAASWAFQSPNTGHKSAGTTAGYDTAAKSPSQPRAFSFAERVAYQRAIEDVYWRHRIWPKENPDPKPALDAVISQRELENKVAGYLRDSLTLEDHWQKPITAEQLQTEMDRMARNTKQPEVLRELFEALGNDPAVIAECLARPTLVERLIADFSAQDQTLHVESQQTDGLRTMSVVTTLGQVVYTLPEIADAGDPPCTDDTWTATSTTNAPIDRFNHTAVWTGTEMIVWGGYYYNTGGRYYPSTDSWAATTLTNAPVGRQGHTAVWTGFAMIVWGGDDGYPANTGGRYRPSTNSWTATSTTNAPRGRASHTAVWTGSEMIVWAGADWDSWGNYYCLYTGGRYNPSTNSWIAINTTNVPDPRAGHTAVWTGSEMIAWGGYDGGGNFLGTGGRYNPSTDSWTATSTTNAPYRANTGVWTGSEMIVWGGDAWARLNTGGRYNPSTDSWTATSTTNAPAARMEQTAVWTGSEMIVWGGNGVGAISLNTGGRYNPDADSWTATSITNAPAARELHTAVWTGSQMIVWGGLGNYQDLNTGGRYCAESGPTPTPTPTVTPTATPTPTATATPTPTPTPTPCTGRCLPTPRPHPSPAPRA